MRLLMHMQRLQAAAAHAMIPTVRVDGMAFHCTSPLAVWMTHNMLTKQPEAVKWIDSLPTGAEFWDIGASIGHYGAYAARRGLRVTMFEPFPGNYASIEQNHPDTAYFCVAFGERTTTGIHTDGGSLAGEPFIGFAPCFGYGNALIYSIDDFIRTFDVNRPEHIKLDTGGAELSILLGATNTLKTVRTIMVRTGDNAAVITAWLAEHGFTTESQDRPGYGEMLFLNGGM